MCEGLSSIHNNPIIPHPVYIAPLNADLSNLSSRSGAGAIEGPSKISGPIASHFDSCQFTDYYVAPKVRNAGGSNFNADKKGNGVGLLIAGQSLSAKKKDIPQTNFMASNATKIKQIMRKVKEREAQKDTSRTNTNAALYGPVAAPVKAFVKSEKYKNVQSKVKESLQLQEKPLAPRESNFLRAHSRTGGITRPQSARQSPKTNEAKNNSQKKYASKDDFDFLKLNSNLAKQTRMKRAPSVENLKQVQIKMDKDLENYQKTCKGKIPAYLEKRNEEIKIATQHYYDNLPDPECPPGHHKLPDDERRKTLNLLRESEQKMNTELNKLPIRTDTFRLQTTKTEFEKKLTEIEEAIKIFSKPKVFVKD